MQYNARAPISLKLFLLKYVNIRFIYIAFVVILPFWKPMIIIIFEQRPSWASKMIIISPFISCTHKVMQALHRYCTCDSSISFCYVSPIHCLFSFCVTFSFVFLLGQNRASWNVKSIIRVICRVSKKFVLLISCTITFDQNFIFRWNF